MLNDFLAGVTAYAAAQRARREEQERRQLEGEENKRRRAGEERRRALEDKRVNFLEGVAQSLRQATRVIVELAQSESNTDNIIAFPTALSRPAAEIGGTA